MEQVDNESKTKEAHHPEESSNSIQTSLWTASEQPTETSTGSRHDDENGSNSLAFHSNTILSNSSAAVPSQSPEAGPIVEPSSSVVEEEIIFNAYSLTGDSSDTNEVVSIDSLSIQQEPGDRLISPSHATQHRRVISWGMNQHMFSGVGGGSSVVGKPPPAPGTTPNIASQPTTAHDVGGGSTRSPMAATTSSRPPLPRSYSHNTTEEPSIVSVRDLNRITPFEEEAAGHILKAIERRTRLDSMSDSATIFSYVPDDRVGAFAAAVQASYPTEEPVINQQRGVAGDSATVTSSAGGGDGGGANGRPNTDFTREASVPMAAEFVTQETQDEEAQPLIKTKSSRHRYEKSVEQRLLGITAALSAMNEEELDGTAAATTKISVVPPPTQDEDEDLLFRTGTAILSNIEGLHKQKESETVSVGNNGSDIESAAVPSIVVSHQVGVSAGNDHEDSDAGDHNNGTTNGDSLRGLQSVRGKLQSAIKSNPAARFKADWEVFTEIMKPRKASASLYIKTVVFFVVAPSTAAACILYYIAGNPYSGYNDDDGADNSSQLDEETASISWWLMFLGVRQVVTFSMSLLTQIVVIDYLAFTSFISLRILGPVFTLLLVGSKGWPFLVFVWSLFNLLILSGPTEFAKHWGYMQNYIGLFNEVNPSGDFVNSDQYYQILKAGIAVGLLVAAKRLVLSIFLSRRTYVHYNEELAKIMADMLLVAEVARLPKQSIQPGLRKHKKSYPEIVKGVRSMWAGDSEGDEETLIGDGATTTTSATLDPVEKTKLIHLLDQWEEPTQYQAQNNAADFSIGAVLQFRRALAFIEKQCPFSNAFGPADTRENCVLSSQQLFERLLAIQVQEWKDDSGVLNFEVIVLAAKENGSSDLIIDEGEVKALIKLFRPSRDGKLTRLEFVKSIDTVYKAMRLLRASIANSSQLDKAFERIINVVFYTIVICFVLAQLGIDPMAVFLSFSSVILAFAFMFGSASARYFEGLLLILVQRPFDVGDKIYVSSPESETSSGGSFGWYVENIGLFHTTVQWCVTNERATVANGAIASMRIINAARSPNAQVIIPIKFGIDTPYEKIRLFQSALEQFIKSRPREWKSYEDFMAGEVEPDKGYIEFIIVVIHRDSWQESPTVAISRTTLKTYCLEVSKQLDMRYKSPHLPVEITLNENKATVLPARTVAAEQEGLTSQVDALSSHFRSLALNHGLREPAIV